MAKANGGKNQRKVDRNKEFCKVYELSHRRERNKLLRLKKHLSRHPADACASAATETAKAAIRGY